MQWLSRLSSNAAVRAHKRTTFAFQEIANEYFFTEYWTKGSALFAGSRDRLDQVFGWSQFNEVLDAVHTVLYPPDIVLIREDIRLPVETYSKMLIDNRTGARRQIIPSKMMALCQSGATLVVNGIQRFSKPLTRLAVEVASLVNERVSINAYYSVSGVRGFSAHYDTHEVFVFQVGGSKEWRIGGTTVQYPVAKRPAVPEEIPGNCEVLRLRQGDILYIPRGVWHSAAATSEPSLHLSVGVHCRTRLDFLRWMIEEMSEEAEMRRNWCDPLQGIDKKMLADCFRSAIDAQVADGAVFERFDRAWNSDSTEDGQWFDAPRR
jgi:ribosomal protein L16 Arg81 hydroxylase